MEVAVTPGDTAWERRVADAKERYWRAFHDQRGLPLPLRVPSPPEFHGARFCVTPDQHAAAEAVLRRCGGRKAALDRLFDARNGMGLRFGSRPDGDGRPAFLVASTRSAEVDTAVEELRRGGVEITPLLVSP